MGNSKRDNSSASITTKLDTDSSHSISKSNGDNRQTLEQNSAIINGLFQDSVINRHHTTDDLGGESESHSFPINNTELSHGTKGSNSVNKGDVICNANSSFAGDAENESVVAGLSPEECQMLEQENLHLYNQLQSTHEEVKQITRQVCGI